MSRAQQLRDEADLAEAEEAFVKAKAKHARKSKPYEEAKQKMRALRHKVRKARETA